MVIHHRQINNTIKRVNTLNKLKIYYKYEICERVVYLLSLMDNQVKSTLQKIPLLTVKAGPRDNDLWISRLKQEYKALIEV